MSKPNEILIDVGSVGTREELHSLLATSLGFPDYYGKNWDAFNECIRDFPPNAPVRIKGLLNLDNALPRDATLMRQCFQAFVAEMPHTRISYVG